MITDSIYSIKMKNAPVKSVIIFRRDGVPAWFPLGRKMQDAICKGTAHHVALEPVIHMLYGGSVRCQIYQHTNETALLIVDWFVTVTLSRIFHSKASMACSASAGLADHVKQRLCSIQRIVYLRKPNPSRDASTDTCWRVQETLCFEATHRWPVSRFLPRASTL